MNKFGTPKNSNLFSYYTECQYINLGVPRKRGKQEYFGNILLGGIIGMLIVDPATGAMWKIDTEHLNETLTSSSDTMDAEMKILDINDIPDSLKQHLVQID